MTRKAGMNGMKQLLSMDKRHTQGMGRVWKIDRGLEDRR